MPTSTTNLIERFHQRSQHQGQFLFVPALKDDALLDQFFRFGHSAAILSTSASARHGIHHRSCSNPL
jgi:hypothetical protein